MGGGNASFLIALPPHFLSAGQKQVSLHGCKEKQGQALLFPIPELLLKKEK